jgi:hypothetical protein
MGQAKNRLKAAMRETGDDIKAAQALLIEQAKDRSKMTVKSVASDDSIQEMPDPMDALLKLQEAITNNQISLHDCEIHTDLKVIIDTPAGIQRITYVKQVNSNVQAVAIFAHVESIDGIPCFHVGYAVISSMRGQGLATDILRKGIDELNHAMKRNGATQLCIEAVVSVSNASSNKVAANVLSNNPKQCTDARSGQAVMQYIKTIDF